MPTNARKEAKPACNTPAPPPELNAAFQAENILQVSYGEDTSKARAKKRRIRVFKLHQ